MPSSRRRRLMPLLAVAMSVLVGADGAAGAPADAPADAVADLVTRLDRLLSFIEWPEAAFAGPGSPLVLGILGEAPFPAEAFARRSVGGRPIRVERIEDPAAAGACQALWIGGGVDPGDWPAAGAPALTVSDRKGFVGGGGMVELHAGAAPALDLSALGRGGLTAHPHLREVSAVTR